MTKFNRVEKLLIWAGIWVVTRLLIVAQVGFWNHTHGPEYQDVYVYEGWSNFIVENNALPQEETWQYPPAAAFLMLIPRIGGGSYPIKFVVLMLALDLIGLGLVTVLQKRGGSDWGVWIWLLGMPMLFALPALRFDLVPTVLMIGSLVAFHRRPLWFGALAGLGAAIKVWPIFALFGEWDRGRAWRAAAAAAVTIVIIFVVSQIAFGDQTGFLTHQGDRGLQVEAVGASPWELRELVTGTTVPIAQRYGTNEIDSDLASAVAHGLDVVALLVLVAAAVWWWMRDRRIARGREDLADPDLARDFVFTLVLLFIVISRVLSPQYLIWTVGMAAIVLSSTRTRILRPTLIVVGAIVLTAGLYQSPANFVIRNLALLVAACDASWIMIAALRERSETLPEKPETRPATTRQLEA